MDSLITAAARALAAGDPLGALKRVALREDAPALALRGIAMAQLGDLVRAKALLRRAARAFGPREAVARARCVVAEAEVALASRDLGWPEKSLDAARATLAEHGDRVNAAHAGYLEVRRLLLIGRLDEAERMLADLDPAGFPPASRAVHELVIAGARDPASAHEAGARRARAGRPLRARGAHPGADGRSRRRRPRPGNAGGAPRSRTARSVSCCSRTSKPSWHRTPSSWTGAGTSCAAGARWSRSRPVRCCSRSPARSGRRGRATFRATLLVARAFGAQRADESHRARLRVEVGRLRRVLRPIAERERDAARLRARAAPRPRGRRAGAPPRRRRACRRTRLLADGESWSSSALALALGASQRTVQRALDALAAAGKVQSFGRGRARRWMTPPVPGFTTTLLLPAPLPID